MTAGRYKPLILAFWVLIGLTAAQQSAMADSKKPLPSTVDLVTTNWPPYTGEALDGFGLTAKIVKQAFDATDIETSIEEYPWPRALRRMLRDQGYDAVFPVYDTPERRTQFLLSDPVGTSPLGFVHLHSTPFEWRVYGDLTGYMTGYVLGYAYEWRLREMLDSNAIRSFAARDDETLLRQLVGGRIEVIVMDHNVARYLIETRPELAASSDMITFNPKLVSQRTLHVGFPTSDHGKALRAAFNSGLKQLECKSANCNSFTVPEALPSEVFPSGNTVFNN